MYKAFVAMRFKAGKMTAAEVWALVDAGKLSAQEAASICGARP